ncbi:MAG: adenylate/guanylate cyclase domain-containing protein, partial [Sediminispirochaetaceae bacterium]
MKHRIILPLLAFLLALSGALHCEESVQDGFADLSDYSFSENGAVKLDGPWEFVYGEFTDPDTLDDDRPNRSARIVEVPGKWSEAGIEGVGSDGYGYGTYRLRIRLPGDFPPQMAVKIGFVGTAYRLFVDGTETARVGNPGTDKGTSQPKWQSQVAEFAPADSTVELVLHTSNFHDTTSGVMDSIWLGTVDQAYRVRYGGLMYELFLFGVLLIMAFYHLGLYFQYRSDRAPLFFSLMTFVFALRIVVYGELFIHFALPSISWSLLTKTGYLTFSLAVILFFRFIYQLFREYVHRPVRITVDGVSILYSLIIIFTPSYIYQRLLTAFQLFTLAVALYILYVLVRAARGKKPGAGFFITGFLFMFVTLVHDIIKAMVVLPTIFLVPFGLFVFIFFQSMVMTKKFAVAFRQTEQMSAHLLQLNTSLERFVPKEFLRFLEKESLMDIQLGDPANHTMTVMFADIRDFTSLSEKLTPEENFKFINSYLNRMGPIIRNHGGFVDKYLGDGIMALF